MFKRIGWRLQLIQPPCFTSRTHWRARFNASAWGQAWLIAFVLLLGIVPQPLALRAQQPPNCIERVTNGSFEATASGWKSVARASLFTYATDQRISGQRSLLLGFGTPGASPANLPTRFGVEQFLELPVESESIEFGFHYAIDAEGAISDANGAYLTFHDTATNQLLAMLVLSPTGGAWNMGRYDLTPLAGKGVRLAFVVENGLPENDSAGGTLAMRVDDVSVLACLPPESFALEPLPTPSPTPATPTPEPLVLTPLSSTPSPTLSPPLSPTGAAASTPTMAPPSGTPVAPQAAILPQVGSINSLEACSCASGQYACSSFSSWAVAQACYTRCQVAAGYDIHNLDLDRNGVACELELQDVARIDAAPSPQPTPSQITDTMQIDANAPVAVANAVTESITVSQSVVSNVMTTDSTTSTVVSNTVATDTVDGTGATTTTSLTVAAAPPPGANAITPLPAGEVTAPTTLSTVDLVRVLLFSPLGYLAIGVLVVLGALSLWVAYMLGQRRQAHGPSATPAEPPKSVAPPHVPDELALQPSNDSPPRKE